MNFYKHYMGDYQRDTKHLTIAQDGAYRRLLDHYYATKKALPNEHETLCRVAGAISQQDQAAVKFVVSEFFKAGEDGLLHNKRADQEIAKADEYSESQRKRINKRWGKDTGVIPGNNPESYPEDTSHSHSHIPKTKAKEEKALSGEAPDAMPIGKQATEVLVLLNSLTGKHYEPVAANLERIKARIKEGADYWDIRSVVAMKCREWSGDEKMCQYLRPATLFNREKFWQYHGQLHREDSHAA